MIITSVQICLNRFWRNDFVNKYFLHISVCNIIIWKEYALLWNICVKYSKMEPLGNFSKFLPVCYISWSDVLWRILLFDVVLAAIGLSFIIKPFLTDVTFRIAESYSCINSRYVKAVFVYVVVWVGDDNNGWEGRLWSAEVTSVILSMEY